MIGTPVTAQQSNNNCKSNLTVRVPPVNFSLPLGVSEAPAFAMTCIEQLPAPADLQGSLIALS